MAKQFDWRTHRNQLAAVNLICGQILFAPIRDIKKSAIGAEGDAFGQRADLGLSNLMHRLAIALQKHGDRMVVAEKGIVRR